MYACRVKAASRRVRSIKVKPSRVSSSERGEGIYDYLW
jgi:hypothetical protein